MALTAPQPTLDHLAELVEQHRAVGGEAELRITGQRVPLPAAWELSAYRITQEALTNARKHAPGARTVVEIDYGADQLLTLRVHDDGPGPVSDPGSGAGHGLTGMRERAALVCGRLSAGAGPDGGFLVEAELPGGPGDRHGEGDGCDQGAGRRRPGGRPHGLRQPPQHSGGHRGRG
ncbi:hypothetical protein SHKM778_23680 [Streptomyces sp. KM77-8]|uniref:histidine kinase n=1 Tax=Streptomyces haneummycinicus TaxID=3074435 RepID=A0AAT9HEW3_9ACTN